MSTLEFMIFGMAVWRVSSLLVHEDGPHAIFRRSRDHCERKGYELFWQLLQCVWCTSVWVAGGLLALWLIRPQLAFMLALPLSWSALAIIIQTAIETAKGE